MPENATSERSDDPSLARIGAFSDGVFAFAITLLVLTIRIPHPTDADASAGLLTLLTQQWRNCLAYVLSFMLVGINWANHRVMFSKFSRSSHVLIWLNMLYLMLGVAFMPIPTAILGDWIGNPQNQVIAAVFYGAASILGGISFNMIWWYGAYAGKLTLPRLTTGERRAHTMAWGIAPLSVMVLTAVAFVNPMLAMAGYVAIIVFYVLPVPGLMALHQRRHRGNITMKLPLMIVTIFLCGSLAHAEMTLAIAKTNAETGNPRAEVFLAALYMTGELGAPKDFNESVAWSRKAAEQGYAPGETFLGTAYSLGQGVQQDPVEAAKWWRKAAEQGDPDAEAWLGDAYYFGQGVPKDHALAMKLLQRAADQQNRHALSLLKLLH